MHKHEKDDSMFKKWILTGVSAIVLAGGATWGFVALQGCGGSSSLSGSTTSSQALNANETNVSAVTTAYNGTCEKVTRDTTSCQSAREALGLSGNWLSFSCNVQLGLATSSLASTTTYSSATYVSVTIVDLPDYTSNYFSTSGDYDFTANGTTIAGSYDSMYSAYTTTFPDPSSIESQSVVMYIPINPTYSGSQTMSGGIVGVSINGIGIYDNLANDTDDIFAESGSFDQCQGHPANGQYHYHSEPYSISYNDNNLIGVMRDGYFIYGRQDHDGTIPGSTSALESAGTSSTLYKYGGHTGADPITNSGSTFHYHLTEWEGCYDETLGQSGYTKSSDDGETNDTLNSPAGSTCGGSWVDAWFLTGHGNGGVFMTTPTGIGSQTPSQRTTGVRYYYGTPGSCTGCTG
jgi:hypothetical protein